MFLTIRELMMWVVVGRRISNGSAGESYHKSDDESHYRY